MRILQHEGERIETGALQIGEGDWPGVFIRGDHAFHYALFLESLLESQAIPAMAAVTLKDLVATLKSSDMKSVTGGEGR